MFIAENTKHHTEFAFAVHASAAEAVSCILADLGEDYRNRVYASNDGQTIIAGSGLDFTVAVYPSAKAAIEAQVDLDDGAMPAVLRALADAIADGVARGL